MTGHLYVEGITGPSGARYIQIRSGDTAIWLPQDRFLTDERGARAAILAQGISTLAPSEWRKLVDKVGHVREYPDVPIIEKVGWNGAHFALPDGTIFPTGESRAPAAIDVHRHKCAQTGKFKHWYNRVAKPLEGQHLATFLMMTAFAPPLLSLTDRVGNFGFEIVGRKGTGKSTLQYLISSALGGVGQGPGGHYWVTLDTTYNALEDTMKLHSDLPIIMDEANLLAADARPSERAALFKALAFRLGSGSLKNRFGSLDETDYRLVFIISSNEPLATLLGQSTESARAAADRLLTLPVEDGRPHGVFDRLPDRYSSGSEFAHDLMRQAGRHHGHAMRRFLTQLVKTRAADEAALKRKIQKRIRQFRKKAGVDEDNGSAVRVADAFGLVFAAGKLAQEYGVLPRELRTGTATLRCYRLHIGHAKGANTPFVERLSALASHDSVTELTKRGPAKPGALAYLWRRGARAELLVPPANIETLIPDWRQIKGSREVERYLAREGDHRTVKRRIGGKAPERVHCFRLP